MGSFSGTSALVPREEEWMYESGEDVDHSRSYAEAVTKNMVMDFMGGPNYAYDSR